MSTMNVSVTKTNVKTTISRGSRFRGLWKYRWLYAFMLPGLLYFILFRYVPLWGLIMAFKNYQPHLGLMGSEWVGFKHFERFFGMPEFWQLFRNTMLLGFALMAGALFALDRVTSASMAAPLLAFASACWTLPMVNAYPLFIEPIPRHQRGFLAALFLLSMALGGAIGDPLNGAVFDLSGSYRPLFLMMTVYTVLAFVAVMFVPRGAGIGSGRSRFASDWSAYVSLLSTCVWKNASASPPIPAMITPTAPWARRRRA